MSVKNYGKRCALILSIVVLLTVASSAISPIAFAAWSTYCCKGWLNLEGGAGFARNDPGCVGFVNQAPASERPATCQMFETAVKSRDNGNLCPDLLAACGTCKPFSAKPDPAALKSWQNMVQVSPGANADEQEAIDRFLQSPEGVSLEEALQKMFCSHPDKSCWPKIRITFGPTSDAEGGHFSPDKFFPNPFDPESEDPAAWQQFFYDVTILPQIDTPALPPHYWPGGSALCIRYSFSSGASEMATTIYHELLHIWWINNFQNTYTGHDPDAANCSSYAPGFMKKLKDFYGDMDNRKQCQGPGSSKSPASSPAPSPAPQKHQ
ncbi:hypothetical protein [Candidatus Binatus sp.]|uniref:hypothetical protein n=1 Tax=Candidatus Binatus sp. TaxID=2811406 RepID=UPI002F94AF53